MSKAEKLNNFLLDHYYEKICDKEVKQPSLTVNHFQIGDRHFAILHTLQILACAEILPNGDFQFMDPPQEILEEY